MCLRDSVGHEAGQRRVNERRCGRHEVAVEQRAQASKYVRRRTQRPAREHLESMQQGRLLLTLPLLTPNRSNASPICLLLICCRASITYMQDVLAVVLQTRAALRAAQRYRLCCS